MKWKDVTEEKPSAEFRARTLAQADTELAKLRSAPQPFWQRRFVLTAVMAAAVLALIPGLRSWLRRSPQEGVPVDTEPLALMDAEILDNADLLNHLDILQDLDILEAWDGKDV